MHAEFRACRETKSELFTMHENEISKKIIGAAIEAHRILGL